MEASPTQKPTFFYKLYRLLIVPALLWYMWLAQYVLFAEVGVTRVYTEWAQLIGTFILTPISILMGFAIMRRLPGNVIGPALIVFACVVPSELIADFAIPTTQGSLNVFVLWTFMFSASLITTTHFPSGKVHPPNIKPIVYGVWVMIVMVGVISLIAAPTSYGSNYAFGEFRPNPFAIEALAPLGRLYEEHTDTLLALNSIVGFLLILYRYFHTTRAERKQMRWMLLLTIPSSIALFLPQVLEVTDTVALSSSLGILLAIFGFPIAIAIGVLFYGLWDIDVIIRRTLVYSVVSALLALTYYAIVLTSQTFLSGFIPEDNTLLIIVSTLVIAALFNPVLQRVQRVIDRLFYRKRYDANVTLELFSEQIRDAVDAKTIERQMLDTVNNTIHPETVSLWVVEPQNDKS